MSANAPVVAVEPVVAGHSGHGDSGFAKLDYQLHDYPGPVRTSLFAQLERVPRSSRGEYELTSAISQLIEAGKLLRIFAIEGHWRDIGRPEDLEDITDF